MILILIYLIGFLLTLTFFKYFGERSGMGGYNGGPYEGYDYDDYDDYKNNEEAFIAFSTAWFIVIPILLIVGMFKLLVKISTCYLK
jgi:hypothetical protein